MGSDRRWLEALTRAGVPEDKQQEMLDTINLMESASDNFSDALYAIKETSQPLTAGGWEFILAELQEVLVPLHRAQLVFYNECIRKHNEEGR